MFVLQYFTEFEIATPTLEVTFPSFNAALADVSTYATQRIWEKKGWPIRAEISLQDRIVFRCEF
jgi:hypothetical protein